MEIKKSCENCGYNDGYPCSKWEGCFPYDGAKNWAPDYQTLEAQCHKLINKASSLETSVENLKAQLEQYKEALENLVDSVKDLINKSDGVIGLHENGDVALWSDLTAGGYFEGWLYSLCEAEELLTKAKGG